MFEADVKKKRMVELWQAGGGSSTPREILLSAVRRLNGRPGIVDSIAYIDFEGVPTLVVAASSWESAELELRKIEDESRQSSEYIDVRRLTVPPDWTSRELIDSLLRIGSQIIDARHQEWP